MSTAAHEQPSPANEAAAQVGGLFARHGRMVYGICRAMLRDVYDAEDATQQVFLSAHKALLAGAEVRDPGGWVATIARNECRARIAAGMRQPLALADEDLDAVADTGDEFARQALREEINAALVELPERQREAVVLRYLYGLRYGEVATALGLSKPATEALLFRARRAMRTSLRPVAGAALAVPVAVREQLAFALPGFDERAAPMALGVGAAGGILAKLAAGGAGVKVATATVAVATVGTVGTVSSDRPGRAVQATPLVAPDVRAADEEPDSRTERTTASEARDGRRSRGDDEDRSGPGDGSGDDREDGSGSGGRGEHDVTDGDDQPESAKTSDRSGPGPGSDERTDSSDGTVDDDASSGSGSSGSGSTSSGSSGSGGSDARDDDDRARSGSGSSGASGSDDPEGSESSSGSDDADDD